MSTILPIFTLVLLTHRSDCASRHHTPFNIIHLIRTDWNDNHSQHVERPASRGPDENESHSPCGMPMRMIRICPLRMVVGWEPLSFTQKEKKNYFSLDTKSEFCQAIMPFLYTLRTIIILVWPMRPCPVRLFRWIPMQIKHDFMQMRNIRICEIKLDFTWFSITNDQ